MNEIPWPDDTATPDETWSKLPVCGCGEPDEVFGLYHWLLASLYAQSGEFDVWHVPVAQLHDYLSTRHAGMFWAVLYALDFAKITEHGGNATHSWLTDTGKRILRLFDRFGSEPGMWPSVGEVNGITVYWGYLDAD